MLKNRYNLSNALLEELDEKLKFDPDDDEHFIADDEAFAWVRDALAEEDEDYADSDTINSWLDECEPYEYVDEDGVKYIYFLISEVEEIIETQLDEIAADVDEAYTNKQPKHNKTTAGYRFVFEYPFDDDDFRYKDEEYNSLEDALAAADKYWDEAIADSDELYLDDEDLSESEYWHDVYHVIEFWLEEYPNYRTDGSLDKSERNENGAIMISMYSVG